MFGEAQQKNDTFFRFVLTKGRYKYKEASNEGSYVCIDLDVHNSTVVSVVVASKSEGPGVRSYILLLVLIVLNTTSHFQKDCKLQYKLDARAHELAHNRTQYTSDAQRDIDWIHLLVAGNPPSRKIRKMWGVGVKRSL